MWNAYALTLALATIVGLLGFSLVFACRETVTGFRDLFDHRTIRRGFRDARRFRISTLLWATAYVAFSILFVQLSFDPSVNLVIIPMVGLMLLLIRVAVSSVTERRVRRLPDTPMFLAEKAERKRADGEEIECDWGTTGRSTGIQ